MATMENKTQATSQASTDGATGSTEQAPARLSLLDAAALELSRADEPKTCREIVQAILANGTWTTSGKTPTATLSAALHREIKGRGDESRFAKAGRGRFELRQAVTS